jgi:hypothetical protein
VIEATGLWPWLVLAGLGTFHGINPAMGWLFAVALGLHRRSRAVVLGSLLPIALGHALAIATVAAVVAAAGSVVDQRLVRAAAGIVLVGWGLYHLLYGTRHRVRFGMRVGLVGLAVWSFLMATTHGAGLMLVPVLVPLCLAAAPGGQITAGGSVVLSLAAVGVHTLAMLAAAGLVAIVVFEWVGVAVLRRGWINLDLLWTLALVGTGLLLLLL